VTSIKDDPMLSNKNKNIFSFYIGDKTARIKFFITLKAKILIMDMPDLGKYHIKKSRVYPVHYIYIFHSMFSIHSYLRKGAIDNFDTIFCVGEHHENEIKETEKVYELKPKKLVKYGFGRLDALLLEKQTFQKTSKENKKTVIIAPSYGENNLLEICGIELLEILLNSNFRVLLRPHFKILKESKELINTLKEKFSNNPNFILEKSVIPSEQFHNSICLISDWSGISFEYAFTFERPVVFIDVPKKILNKNSEEISYEPIEISKREKIGYVINLKNLETIPSIIECMNEDISKNDSIRHVRDEIVYNLGNSAKIGGNYIEKLLNDLK
tara:strand:- start:54 stop:1034 length:981 start_codon:yes stop_codon:yes gene_type:complete